jgi:hypothetical protein
MRTFTGLDNLLLIRNLLLSKKYFLLMSDDPSIPSDDFFDFCKKSDIKKIVFGAEKDGRKVEAGVYLVEKTERVQEYFEKKYDIHSFDLSDVAYISFSARTRTINIVRYKNMESVEKSVDRMMQVLEILGRVVLEMAEDDFQ